LVNRDESGEATGTLLLDEGISRKEITNNDYEFYTVTHSGKSIQFTLSAGSLGKQENYVDQLVILNAGDMKEVGFACYLATDNTQVDLDFRYDEATNALYLTPKTPTKFNQIKTVYYGNKGETKPCEDL
jgi:hypothetical protein